MPDPSLTTRIRSTVMTIAVIVVTTSCESTDNWLRKWTDSDKEAIILGAPGAHEYLHDMYELARGDPATQAKIFANAKAAALQTPGTSTQLRYALMLATPGHAETSDVAAQSLLRSLLAEPELMTPAETALATIHLHEVEERMVLSAEARALRAENSRAATTGEAAVAQGIARVEAENRRLRQSLTDAESKLDALSDIERSLREQSANADPQ